MNNPDWRKCLLCRDSKELIKMIPDNSIDLIFTDPPYNLSQHSTGNIPLPGRSAMNNDIAVWDTVDFNPEDWADEFVRILKPMGNMFIFTSYNQIGRWYECLDKRFDATNFMIWHKTNPAPKIFKAGFLNSCEMIYTCWNKHHTWNFLSQAEMHNFFESPICMRPERLADPKHPAQKPVALLKKVITIATNAGDIVFDPFMGVGSVGVAAIGLGRKFIGVEIDRTYYNAAKRRIKDEMDKLYDTGATAHDTASEPEAPQYYTPRQQNQLFDDDTLPPLTSCNIKDKRTATMHTGKSGMALPPIIKWAGGKEKELKYIIPNLPSRFDRYIEPFVGGGAVFMAVPASEYLVNDLSSELVCLYRCIARHDKAFFTYVRDIDASWAKAGQFYAASGIVDGIYRPYRDGRLSERALDAAVDDFCRARMADICSIVPHSLGTDPAALAVEMDRALTRKMRRMRQLEAVRHPLPDKDLGDNIETAIKGALYMYYRHLYNGARIVRTDEVAHCALFCFIRNYCYSGMFRYNADGAFNVPYGGIAYNSKNLSKKLRQYSSREVIERFSMTEIFNLDFEAFLWQCNPTGDDFIFLDPPYDSEFSTYAGNEFTRADQQRLAAYLLGDCRAKWMLVIKNTDFIRSLYEGGRGINIRSFDKEYAVSFMNRNDRRVTHLLITNY